MAIDPYEPELAKRKTSFQIAHKQLNQVMGQLSNLAHRQGSDFQSGMTDAEEALKDYQTAGWALAEWLERKPENCGQH